MLKDVAGRAEEEMEVHPGATAGEIFDRYAERYPLLREYEHSIVIARNQEFSTRAEEVASGDELAFLPPVSGGSGPYLHEIRDSAGHLFALTDKPIDTQSLKAQVLRGEDGAVVDFQGVVRNNTKGRPTQYLEYECYEPMAIQTMARIGRDIVASHEIDRIAMVHRLGRMEIGETSVAVVVSAAHRGPAFAAALEGINRLKKTVPIWKKEFFADGGVWVEGEWDESLVKK